METFYKFFELFGMFISFVCCVEFLRVKASDNQRNLMLTSLCGFIACVGNALEVYSTSPAEAMVAIKVAYIGKCYIMTFGLMFVSGYSSVKLPKHLFKFLGIANTIILASIMTCERQSLYYNTIECEIRPNGRAAMILGKGPLYYVWIALLMMTALIYIGIVWRETKRGSRIAKMRMGFIFLAVASPMVTAVIFLILQPRYFDPATLAIVMTEVCFLIASERYGLLDTLELARERILEDTKDGVIVVDNTKSIILYANPVAAEFVKRVSALNGELNFDLFHGTNEFVYEFEEKHYEIRISEIKQKIGSNDIQGYIIWLFDMSFIDQYTNEMIRLKEESEKANQAKTQFLAHMSHEIRTPMNSIVGYAEMAMRTSDDVLIHSYIRNIKESSRTLLHLINEILDISKIETGKMENVKVNYRFQKLVCEIQSMMGAQAGNAGLVFLIEVDDTIPEYLYGDRVKIQEIMTNLINNGFKYTREGSVTLRVLLKETEEKRVHLHIEVEDTGVGIRKEDYGKVFSKFERLDRQENYLVEGSGLGLSIVKGFVDMLGGTITFESTYGKGTKFIVSIWQDIGYEEQNVEAAENTVEEEIPVNSGKILIVDDNELNCDVASGIMELLGMQTTTVMSGRACLELLEKGERFDMIFMDHMMPEMDGLETMKKIRAMNEDMSLLPIVLLTANAVTGVREEMLREGFDDFLSKPIDVDELRRILIRFLGVNCD